MELERGPERIVKTLNPPKPQEINAKKGRSSSKISRRERGKKVKSERKGKSVRCCDQSALADRDSS